LITGGAGFIGSHLAETFGPHNDVRVLDDFRTGAVEDVPDDATIVRGDVRDEDTLEAAMEGVDVVFHEAAMVSVPESIERPIDCHAVNGSATVSLFESARRADARVVFASSAAIYGDPGRIPVAEDAPKRPRSPYAFEKLLGDLYARFYAEEYGLPTVSLRYFNVYGNGGVVGDYAGVIGTFISQARGGDPLKIEGDGTQRRDFVHVDDVVRANALAATTDEVGRAFNVGTGESVSITELADEIRDVVNSSSDVVHVDRRPGDVDHSEADTTAAERGLGFSSEIELREGLRRTVDADAAAIGLRNN
jgi:UDP-glucose 4-epimerase